MQESLIAGKSVAEWITQYPLIQRLISLETTFWTNPTYGGLDRAMAAFPLTRGDIQDAEARLSRFAPYLARRFDETAPTDGIIESALRAIPEMHRRMTQGFGHGVDGTLLLKCDSHLPISGSIKARGGIYEVLKRAEALAIDRGLISENDDYGRLDRGAVREFFSQFALVVGSTGNLGLSIGIMGADLGFKVLVHMSADARQWKKDLLRRKGVTVIEHAADYSSAVEEGRQQVQADRTMHFIDDENSTDLFLGYAVAAGRIQKQLEASGVVVDQDHPLFVYLPCGVGGAAGGLTFGLKSVYGEHAHCFFAEPTHSPCMLLGLLTRCHDQVSVQDFGIDNRTDADGLAVGRPSGFVGRHLEKMISGVYTVDDEMLYILLHMLADSEKIDAEPSAMAGMPGPFRLMSSRSGQAYLQRHQLVDKMQRAVHLVWSTGGSMVPGSVREVYRRKGAALAAGRDL